MCGRYSLSTPDDVLREFFELDEDEDLAPRSLEPRFNIAPTQEAAVIRARRDSGARVLSFLRWGLVPYWAEDLSIGSRMINARSETAAEKRAFERCFRRRRCLVPADGFYEWKKTSAGKQPYWFHSPVGAPFAFAGLWDSWRQTDGEPLQSFTILTTEPNEVTAEIHDRMPVILDEGSYSKWLDPSIEDPADLQPLLVPYPADRINRYTVSTLVNSPANDSPECQRRVEEPLMLF